MSIAHQTTAGDGWDIIVIGSGVGGLTAGALLARYGYRVLVCEAHSVPGGAAHGFDRSGFRFDSGPSLFSGLADRHSPNPLRQVLNALEVDLGWLQYNTWGCHLPEGHFETEVGADQFCEVLQALGRPEAVAQWRELQRVMEPLAAASVALPTAALRWNSGIFQTLTPFLPQLLSQLPQVQRLTRPFSQISDPVITDPFLRNWLDLLCYLLSGLPAQGTIAAEMAFMFADWYRPGVQLDYPKGGSGALVATLVRGLEKWGGVLRCRASVAEIWVERNQTRGVKLQNGEVLEATTAVISNASSWDTVKLLPEGAGSPRFRQHRSTLPPCPSFMHLHLGIRATGLDPNLACHHIVVNDWAAGVTAPQNVVLISIPSLLDPDLAPPDCHTIHVYTPGNEPYGPWAGLDRNGPAYQNLKAQRAQVMWQALERVIPDVRDRLQVSLVGTPLTHARFLRRHQGSYGPALWAGQSQFPGPKTPIQGLLCCGDSTFPGIGLPAVAASGLIAAHTIAPVAQHLTLLKRLSLIP